MSIIRSLHTRLVLGALLGLLAAIPAHAAFPGANGKIAFVSTRDSGNFEIYAMNADGTGQTRLTNDPGFDDGPVWSPDGSRIAFRASRDGNSEIYVMNADGTGQVNVSNNTANDQDPTWSPDGSRLAFRSDRDGNGEIYVMNADGSNQARLTTNPASDVNPAWSPDGARIAFGSNRDAANNEIYVMNADGSGQVNVSNNAAADFEPDWSPDSNRLVFRSDRDGNIEIYVMDADGSSQTRRTTNAAIDSQPAWSPDGSRIAFFSNRDGNQEIYLMNADGTSQANVSNNAANDTGPNWQRTAPSQSIVVRGFEGTSYLDNCALGQCFRPPTPSGAIGTTQFLEANNGSVAIYDKATGALVQRTPMPTFWASVGLPGGSGIDQRVLFDHFTNRWIISSLGPTGNTRNLAISDSDNALGTWKSVRITVLAAGGTADAATLSVDEKAVYISTNNFNPLFVGTSLLVIPKTDLFNGAPTLANMTTFTTPIPVGPDRGFLIQVALNWQANPAGSAAVIADSPSTFGLVFYRLNGVGAAGATQTTAAVIAGSAYSTVTVDRARQPDGTRLVQLIGGSITANAVQRDGLVYATSTVRSTFGDFAAVRWTVVDAATGALRSSGLIEQAGYDYYQGTIAINAFGEVVIAYNRSGTAVSDGDGDGLADGNISLMARTYYVDVDELVQTGGELRLRVSGISDYHCGERTPISTSCTQRWGYWAALTIDPGNPRRFYALGAYSSQWAVIPGLTVTPRAIWNTYIAEIEPAPAPIDTDGDGLLDPLDNCTMTVNPTQLDADGDGYGNLCDADLNNSGTVTTADFGLLRSVLGQPAAFNATAAAADMNGSGTVTTADFGLLRARLGTAPGPSGLACAGTVPCP